MLLIEQKSKLLFDTQALNIVVFLSGAMLLGFVKKNDIDNKSA